jgi:threonine/homoserine/homoserine lactone efflux protein
LPPNVGGPVPGGEIGGLQGPEGKQAGPESRDQSAHIFHVVVSSLMNPSPWFFWLVVASPFLLRAWNRSPGEGLAFVGVLFATNITSALGLAWIASHSRKILNPAWQRRALQTVGMTLVLVGVLLLWQASVGNFQDLMDQQEVIRSVVEDGIPAG